MPLKLSPESRADPTHTLTLIERHEGLLSTLIHRYLAKVKDELTSQSFANREMSVGEFFKWVDSLAKTDITQKITWSKDLSSEAYVQGRNFSAVVLGAPLKVRQRAWSKIGVLVQRSDRAFSKMTGDLSADVRRVISDGILQERSQSQILKSIDEVADTYDYAAKRIVRTETMEAVNTGVMDEYRSEGVDRVEWLAAEGCCPRCQDLDGKVFSIDGGVHAPLHPNCRCTLIPVVDVPGKAPAEVEEWTEEE